MRIVHVAALLAAASATPAFAQETPASFNGGHVEAITGYDSVHGGGDSSGGVLYGIGAGYDFRSGNAVFGIEGEAVESTTGDCDGGVCVDASRDFYVGGRVGAVVSPAVLLYAKAGYTNARVEVESGGVSAGTTFDGIRGGAGIEWAIPNSPVALRTEYRYSNYQDGLSRHQGVLALAFRF
ncbi:MAG TPA: porin family protein [Allosphingosinicella sp.]|jgi:outer membrane immunogenic protein